MNARKVFTKDVPPPGLDECTLNAEEVESVLSARRYRDQAIKAGKADTAREMEALAGRILFKAISR